VKEDAWKVLWWWVEDRQTKNFHLLFRPWWTVTFEEATKKKSLRATYCCAGLDARQISFGNEETL
jgi:hypothetical protein